MLNRAVLLLRYKQPFVDWINAVDPMPSQKMSLDDVNEEHTAYLIEAEDEGDLARWIKLNWVALFEEELYGWYTDPELWPQNRSLSLLKKWCDFELHTVVHDLGVIPIYDDEED